MLRNRSVHITQCFGGNRTKVNKTRFTACINSYSIFHHLHLMRMLVVQVWLVFMHMHNRRVYMPMGMSEGFFQ